MASGAKSATPKVGRSRGATSLANAPSAVVGQAAGGTYFGPYSSRPAAGSSGRLYYASDGVVPFVDDGAEWRPIIRGVPGWEAAPGNSMAAYTVPGSIALTPSVQGGCFNFYVSNKSNSPPYLAGVESSKTSGQTITAHLIPILNGSAGDTINTYAFGAWVRDTVGGKMEGVFAGADGNASLANSMDVYTFATIGSGLDTNPVETRMHVLSADGIWLRIVDTGSSLQFWYSMDGVFWQLLYTDTVTFLGSGDTGNAYGVGIFPANVGTGITVDSFRVA